jgi:BirA family transcriptional regulator, biotin operon repressor / biotin---[acetyl-CoA-carboxylase] ligase
VTAPDDDLRMLGARSSGANIGRRFVVTAISASTNHDAREFLATAARADAHGVAFTTREQNAGRGTRGRTWWAPPDAALPLSIILAPEVSYPHPAAITLVAALAVDDAARAAGAATRIRWPNDLVDAAGGKLAGILAEAVSGRFPAYVVGIGVNARPSRLAPPVDLTKPHSDLVSAGARDAGRAALAIAICRSLETRIAEFVRDGVSAVTRAFNERSYLAGTSVELRHGSQVVRGRFEHLDSSFRVVVTTEADERVALPAEQLELLRHV